MDFKFYLDRLQGILSNKRFEHSFNTSNIAVKLAEMYCADREKAGIAGLLHDCARDYGAKELLAMAENHNLPIDDIEQEMPVLLHAKLGAALAKQEFGVDDAQVLKAIALHTLGEPEMGLLAKIVYVADKIEPGRRFTGVESLRKTAFEDLDRAVLQSLDMTIELSIQSAEPIHPGAVATRNWLLRKIKLPVKTAEI
ncbi:bis(5'-nucleosyl)-tetraphosphatase (symmetrical) YqeK [Desulfotruncus alcoholivorax]|uniref:bis(5'-nucleosyl)-tetraphosphatase (symmetrical) YqeK n=1 Tax=Desulfotruncus alcoholivorax TaxID=265477 RepID=UPI00041B6574|nr:bis(5'-nucleosyl)-tetraphosphatase (symmetrical) YqeK [Desulfotruncus alcoholivorax]